MPAIDGYASPFYFGLHLMGGCRLGLDPANSLVGPEFRLHGLEHLYICDSSLLPNSPGINPCLTVVTLARRLGEQLCGNLEPSAFQGLNRIWV